eukprot:scaffold1036_cov135-Skeletonema_dohrnii-CCMP3373.AAC.8
MTRAYEKHLPPSPSRSHFLLARDWGTRSSTMFLLRLTSALRVVVRLGLVVERCQRCGQDGVRKMRLQIRCVKHRPIKRIQLPYHNEAQRTTANFQGTETKIDLSFNLLQVKSGVRSRRSTTIKPLPRICSDSDIYLLSETETETATCQTWVRSSCYGGRRERDSCT